MSSLICQDQMRDPLTLVYSYTRNPSPLRLTCKKLVATFDHAVYLEAAPRHLFFATEGAGNRSALKGGAFPVTHKGRTEEHSPVEITTLLRDRTWYTLYLLVRLHLVDLDHIHGSLEKLGLCSQIRWLRVANLPNVTKLPKGKDFLVVPVYVNNNKTPLREVVFENMAKLATIDERWMERSPQLEVVRFNGMPALTEIGSSFCYDCPALREVVLEDSGEVLEREVSDQINGSFQQHGGAGGREEDVPIREGLVRVAGLPNLVSIGPYFAYNCSTALTELSLTNLPTLTSIGGWCLENAAGLQLVTVGPGLPKLVELGSYFLHRCSKLELAYFDDLPMLTTIGSHALAQCPSLKGIHFSKVPQLSVVGDQFAALQQREAQASARKVRITVEEESCSLGLAKLLGKHQGGQGCLVQ